MGLQRQPGNLPPGSVDEDEVNWGTGTNQVDAPDVPTVTSGYAGALSGADDNVQKVTNTLDTAVGANNAHRISDGKNHSDVVSNNTHRTSNGIDHTYIDQDTKTTASPSFAKLVDTPLESSGDQIIKLGDSAGTNKEIIQDSTGTPVATTDSNGVRQDQIGSDGVYDVRNASGISKVQLSAVGDGHVENSGLTRKAKSADLADDAEFVFDTNVTGFGFVQAGDNEEYALFAFTAAGVVTLISNSANVVNTDTDANLCIYDAGAGIAIKNRLGALKTVRYEINFS